MHTNGVDEPKGSFSWLDRLKVNWMLNRSTVGTCLVDAWNGPNNGICDQIPSVALNTYKWCICNTNAYVCTLRAYMYTYMRTCTYIRIRVCTRNCFNVRMHGGMRTQLRSFATEWCGKWLYSQLAYKWTQQKRYAHKCNNTGMNSI